MKKNIALGVFILVLFFVFYSSYYYYSINMGDQEIELNEEDFPIYFDMERTIGDHSALLVPFKQALQNHRDEKRKWGIFCTHTNEEDQQECRIRSREELVFTSNFYVKTSPEDFSGTTVRTLIARPGHRGRAGTLYEHEGVKVADIPFHDEVYNIVLFRPEIAAEPTFQEVWEKTQQTMTEGQGRKLGSEDFLQFPIIRWHAQRDFSKGPESHLKPDDLEIELAISSQRKDVSLLPSRRHTPDEEHVAEWEFNRPFIFMVTRNELELPALMGYIKSADVLQQE